MNDNILISIIMPAWNAEKTITDAIQSVIAQTYTFWELIIIDDASTDSTHEIIQYFSEIDSRIFFSQNSLNLGIAISRNKGILMARGSWLAFLDSDDLWMCQKLEKQIKLIKEQTNTDLVFTGSKFIHSTGRDISYELHVPKTITYHQLLKQNVISCSSVLVRKKLVLKYPMHCDNMHEDYAAWLQILQNGYIAHGIDEPLMIYRLSAHSKSGNKKKAAVMTYRVYRFIGLGHIRAFYYFMWYAIKSLKKYCLLKL